MVDPRESIRRNIAPDSADGKGSGGKRKELMYLYSEDTASTGYSAADLKAGGTAHSHWPSIQADLIKRAEQSITFH